MKLNHPYAAALLAVAPLAACTAGLEVPERTTLQIPTEGTTLLSADGLFGVRFDAAAWSVAGEVSIETRYDLSVPDMVSKVYEVAGPEALPTAAEVFYAADLLADPSTKLLVTVDGGEIEALDTTWDLTARRLVSDDVAFTRTRFAVIELSFRNGDCSTLVCGDSCTYCDAAAGPCLPERGECNLNGSCVARGTAQCGAPLDGWDDTPAAGAAFVINSIAIAEADHGFDIDGACTHSGCIDNALAGLGAFVNDQLRQSLLGGENLMGFELTGLDAPYSGDDSGLTVKFYGLRDADDPFFPANNFSIPPGHTECCQFNLLPESLSGLPPQSRSRAPARVERGRLRSLAPVPFTAVWGVGAPPHPQLRMERTLMSARVATDLTTLDDGLLGAAVPMNSLAQTENPYCRTASLRCPTELPEASTLLDLVRALLGPQPDVDLDFDGLECALDTDGDSIIDRCCDGGDVCSPTCTNVVPAVDPSRPESCALDPRMADGYSIAFTFTAVQAQIVGIGR